MSTRNTHLRKLSNEVIYRSAINLQRAVGVLSERHFEIAWRSASDATQREALDYFETYAASMPIHIKRLKRTLAKAWQKVPQKLRRTARFSTAIKTPVAAQCQIQRRSSALRRAVAILASAGFSVRTVGFAGQYNAQASDFAPHSVVLLRPAPPSRILSWGSSAKFKTASRNRNSKTGGKK